MISYSLHISSKKHALTTTRKVAGASKHNLRQFESEEYCEENIFVLIGGDNILDDVKECYYQEFDDCLARYNEGKRSDRQIDDYIKYVSESGKNDVAVEMIIQLGDEEFWKDKSLATKQRMVPIFEHQIEHLKELVPDFKIVSAVVHLDEKSPHCHIVGVPIGRGYKRGMEKQAAKTKVFTQESLKELQEQMHLHAEQDIAEHPEIFQGESLKEIEKGRNSDWSKEYYIRQKAEKLEAMTMELASVSASVEAQEEVLDTLNEQTEECIQKLVDNKAQKEFMRYALLQEPKSALGKLVSEAWKKFKKWWDEKQRPEVEAEVRESVMGRLKELKQKNEVSKKVKVEPLKKKGIDR